jgi:hypothetical protein
MYLTFQEDFLNFDRSRKDWNFERAVFEKFIYRRKSEKREKSFIQSLNSVAQFYRKKVIRLKN